MAIGDPYATLDELKTYLFKGQESKADAYDDDLTDALMSASQEIEKFCNRQFNQSTDLTSRVFIPFSLKKTYVDDFWTTEGMTLETDVGGTGDFTQEWDIDADVEIYPLNGVMDGVPGWPYSELWACRGLYFPLYMPNPYRRKAVVRVTAQWGWQSVPAPVHQACLIMAASTWKLRDAPFGVAGFSGMGGAVKVRDNPMAMNKLHKYVINPVQVG